MHSAKPQPDPAISPDAPPQIAQWQGAQPLAQGGGGAVWLASQGPAGPLNPAAFVIKLANRDQQDVLSREWRALLEVPLAMLPEPVWLSPVAPSQHRGRAQALVLARCPGLPLDAALQGHTAQEVLAVGAALLRGLAVLHAQGWVHGDLHAGNVLVETTAAGPEVTLLDLGLADRHGEAIRGPGRLDGAAPDRLRGGLADPRDDLFSLAAALWKAWLGAPAWPNYPAQQPQRHQRPQLPAGHGDPLDQRLLAALSAMLAPERSHRPQDAEAALLLWRGADADPAQDRRWWAQAMRRAGSRRSLTQVGQALPEHRGLWLQGPPGSGRSSLLWTLATQAADSGRAVAWLTSDKQGQMLINCGQHSWAWQAPALRGSLLGDGLAQAAEQGAAWLAQHLDALDEGLAPGWLLADDAGELSPAAAAVLQALLADPQRLPGWRLAAAGGEAPAAAQAWQLPALNLQDLADRLSAVTGGRRWDAAVVAALAETVGARRREALELAAELIDQGAVEIGAERVDWRDGSALPPVVVGELAQARRALQLPDPSWWPLIGRLATASGAMALPPQARAFAERSPLLALRGPDRVAMADQAARQFVLAALPCELVGAELRAQASAAETAAERAALRVRAWQSDASQAPEGREVADAAAALLGQGAYAAAEALCGPWLAAQPLDAAAPELPEVAAALLRAKTAQGQLIQAGELAGRWPEAWDRHRPLLLARAEWAFRSGLYPQCRELATQLTKSDPSDADAWLWLTFAATWQGDREAAALALLQAKEAGRQRPECADVAQYLGGLHSYYAGRLDEAEAELSELLPRARAGLLSAAQGGLGLVSHRRGDLALARQHYQAAAAVAEAIGDRVRAVNMAMNSAVVDHEAGELGRALQGYGRVIELAARAGNPGAEARARNNRGNLLTTLGLFASAKAELQPALLVWQQVDNAYMEGNARCLLGEIARREGHLSEAQQQLAQADAALERAGATHERLEIQLERAHLQLLTGHATAAREAANLVRSQASAAGQRELHGRSLALLALTQLEETPFRALAADRLARVDDDLRLALELLPPSKPLHRTLAAALRVRLLLQRGRLLEAVEAAREQLALVERVALTLTGQERLAFERAPGDAAARAVLAAVAHGHLDTAAEGARTGLLPTLVAINRRLSNQRDIADMLDIVMDSAILLTGAERGFLLIDDGDPADPPEVRAVRLRVAVARNLDRENLKRPQHKLSHSVAEEVFASGDAVLSVDAQADARFAEQASVHTGSLRSILCVPLRMQSGALGVVYVDNRFAAGAFSPEHAALLAALADQAAIAIQTARLIGQQRDTAEALEKARAEVVVLNGQLRAQLAEVEDQLGHARADLDAQRLAIARRSDYSQIKGDSPQLLRLFGLMDRVRDHDFPVLLRGESGTGKELVARAIHFTGRRQKGPFVAVNCGALPTNLLESELFGHARGAFTGAVAERRGLFEAAHGGTLLLDEVGEMPLEMQVKLLRVLQTGEITRVGETATRKVDTRLVAATHRDLQAMVAQGTFREDLLYRLKVVELVIPPLRQRAEDIPLLVEYFIGENRAARVGSVVRVSKSAMGRLVQFAWPGNVRQLETVLKAACLFADGQVLELSDVDPLLSRERADLATPSEASAPGAWWDSASLPEIEERLISSRLERFAGNKKRAAESLGIDRGTLYNKLRERGGSN